MTSQSAHGTRTITAHTISVIIPAYNAEDTLERCVGSVLAQTHADLDVILVDDGSTDISGAMCDAYAEFDPRVRVFHTPNRGLSAARNLGIDNALAAGAQLIAFADADDWLEPEMLERLLAVLESSDADIAQCGRQIDGFRMTSKMAPPAAVRNRREAIREHINGGINSAVWNKLYRSCIFDEVRFPEGRLFEEAATTYRMILCCNRFATDPFIGYHYVMREGSIAHTHTMDNLADYWVAHKRRHDELIREVPDLSYEERDMLAMDVALAISRTWRWAFGSKPDERARHADALLEMHEFAREGLADLDTQHWPSKIRLTLMLARDGSAASLAVGYWLNQVFIKVFPGKSASQQ